MSHPPFQLRVFNRVGQVILHRPFRGSLGEAITEAEKIARKGNPDDVRNATRVHVLRASMVDGAVRAEIATVTERCGKMARTERWWR